MQIIESVKKMREISAAFKRSGKLIGLVPTMGYLHPGHISLLRLLRPRCQVLITSIFVNPAQFGPGEDFSRYPRDIGRDEKMLEENGCDLLFHPAEEGIYPPGYVTYINVEKLSENLCGRHRPGHFRGVATVVAKLFLITGCDIAGLGQKDAQQVAVIKRMVRDLNLPVEIVVGPIIREADGLAMSSRNVYLSPEERINALCLKKALDMAEHMVAEGKRDTRVIIRNMRKFIELVEGAKIDYIEAVDPEDLIPKSRVEGPTLFALAVKIGDTRLIDNCVIQ